MMPEIPTSDRVSQQGPLEGKGHVCPSGPFGGHGPHTKVPVTLGKRRTVPALTRTAGGKSPSVSGGTAARPASHGFARLETLTVVAAPVDAARIEDVLAVATADEAAVREVEAAPTTAINITGRRSGRKIDLARTAPPFGAAACLAAPRRPYPHSYRARLLL